MAIHFFIEDVIFRISAKRSFISWIKQVAFVENKVIGEVNYIFASDDYVLDINKKFLNHDYFTDIITFDDCKDKVLNGDIYISIDTVCRNSEIYKVSFETELKRVIIHGILHLIGYDDKDDVSQGIMRNKEDQFLELADSKFFINR